MANKPTYLMIPRKLIRTWIVVTIVTWIAILFSYQYTNYVDRKSNGLWCGIVVPFDDSYKKNPPPPERQLLAIQFAKLRKDFHCK